MIVLFARYIISKTGIRQSVVLVLYLRVKQKRGPWLWWMQVIYLHVHKSVHEFMLFMLYKSKLMQAEGFLWHCLDSFPNPTAEEGTPHFLGIFSHSLGFSPSFSLEYCCNPRMFPSQNAPQILWWWLHWGQTWRGWGSHSSDETWRDRHTRPNNHTEIGDWDTIWYNGI